MTEILLIIALVIALVLDIVRIRQYRLSMSKNRPKMIRNIANKVCRLYGDYIASFDKGGFEEYAVKHWDEYE